MIKIRTFIKHDDRFLPLNESDTSFSETDYLEGALIIEIDGSVFMGEEFWDLILGMWLLLLQDVLEWARDGTPIQMYFPDQPVTLSILEESGEVYEISLSYNDEKKSASIQIDEFIEELTRAGQEFVNWLKAGAEKDGISWPVLQKLIDDIKAAGPHLER